MPFLLKMPSLSPTMKSGKITNWLVKSGDEVEVGQILAEIETDKAVMEMEAFESGKLYKISQEAGPDPIEVGQIIGVLQLEDEDEQEVEDFLKKQIGGSTNEASEKKVEAKSEDKDDQKDIISSKKQDIVQEKSTEKDSNSRIKASPLAKSIAKNKNLDLKQITGSGPYGRIIKRDVMKSLEQKSSGNNLTSVNNNIAVIANNAEDRVIQPSDMRKVIAQRLTESKQTIPHFYISMECILDEVLALRKKINDENSKITINDFVIKACALAMRAFPEVNCSWQGEKIIQFGSVDVSVAVSIAEGLITPIVFSADVKNLQQISIEMKDLAKRAKENRLQLHEFQGGGMTISNMGMFGVETFQAIINPPQASILAVGAGCKKIVIDADDNQKIKTLVNLTLSVDHRVIDGALAAKFLNQIKFLLENPLKMLI